MKTQAMCALWMWCIVIASIRYISGLHFDHSLRISFHSTCRDRVQRIICVLSLHYLSSAVGVQGAFKSLTLRMSNSNCEGTNTHRTEEEDNVLEVLSNYINNQWRDLTEEVTDLRPHRQHTRAAEVRGQFWLSVASFRSAGESDMTGGERDRDTAAAA